jgi:septal ring factor EnvC (AmiA/AmiB activator)
VTGKKAPRDEDLTAAALAAEAKQKPEAAASDPRDERIAELRASQDRVGEKIADLKAQLRKSADAVAEKDGELAKTRGLLLESERALKEARRSIEQLTRANEEFAAEVQRGKAQREGLNEQIQALQGEAAEWRRKAMEKARDPKAKGRG